MNFQDGATPAVVQDASNGEVLVLGQMNAEAFRLSVADFVRTISVQRLDRLGLLRLRPTVRMLTLAEGLKAHAHSVEVRFAKL